MRASYKKLIEKYAEEFFSPPVLSNMGESIETLEGRDEWALEADIFQVRAAIKANKEKVEKTSSAKTALASASFSSAKTASASFSSSSSE